jgi:hypothetical protein
VGPPSWVVRTILQGMDVMNEPETSWAMLMMWRISEADTVSRLLLACTRDGRTGLRLSGKPDRLHV